MSNPYKAAIDRYQSVGMKERIANDPLAELHKLIGLNIPIESIRPLGDEAIEAICGVILFTQLDRNGQSDVLGRLQALRQKGYNRFFYELDKLNTHQLINRDWCLWSFSNQELKALIEFNADIYFYAKDVALVATPTLSTLGNGIWKSYIQNKGIKGAVVDMSKYEHMRDFLQKKLKVSPKMANAGGAAIALVWFVGTALAFRSGYMLNHAGEEKDRRVGL